MPNTEEAAAEVAAAQPKGQRVGLEGDLAGYYVRVDLDALDCGVLEDLEARSVTKIIDALSRLIVGGDLPHGTDRPGLRRLKPAQLGVLCGVIPGLFDIPNQS